MQFDLKKFLWAGRVPYKAALDQPFSGYDWPGYELDGPVRGSFGAELQPSGKALVRLEVQAAVTAPCARCLEPARHTVCLQREWLLGEQDLLSNELELPISETGVMDIGELVFQELVLEIPPVLLCSPDCQGLCPLCGTPKAAGCSCCTAGPEDAPADQGLAILKQLLSEHSH